jgi:hypothetical protein
LVGKQESIEPRHQGQQIDYAIRRRASKSTLTVPGILEESLRWGGADVKLLLGKKDFGAQFFPQ